MSSPRLRTQFEKLFAHFKGQDSDIQLEEVTFILHCTRRNARIVLNKMTDEGWIEWHPAAGRGNLSQIIFKRNQQGVSENLAKGYLLKGRIDQAFKVLNEDESKFTKVIGDFFGIQRQEDRQVMRLPYCRRLSMLNPLKSSLKAEQNIIRQVFSGLTQLDENEQLQPDLAHRWESQDGLCWFFYLRPDVRFHNGHVLESDHVVDSLVSLSTLEYFHHIKTVSSPASRVIKVTLSEQDWYFPLSMADSKAKILPPLQWYDDQFDQIPIGTGPFKVAVNDDKQLVLQVFEHYFGYRPLLDRVEIRVIDKAYADIVSQSLNHIIKPENTSESIKFAPECALLLLNRKHGLAKDPSWGDYFCSILNTFSLYRSLHQNTIARLGLLPAHGLRPDWRHNFEQKLTNEEKKLPSEKKVVTIAFDEQNAVFSALAKGVATILSYDGLTVEFKKYQHTLDEINSVDIWLKSMNVATSRDDALAGWLLGDSNLSSLSDEADFIQWRSLVQEWRKKPQSAFPARVLGKCLIESQHIIPLFYLWSEPNQENAPERLDFTQIWLKP